MLRAACSNRFYLLLLPVLRSPLIIVSIFNIELMIAETDSRFLSVISSIDRRPRDSASASLQQEEAEQGVARGSSSVANMLPAFFSTRFPNRPIVNFPVDYSRRRFFKRTSSHSTTSAH